MNGETCWLALKRIGPCTIGTLGAEFGLDGRAMYKTVKTLRQKHAISREWTHNRYVYTAIGDAPPAEKRGGARFHAPSAKRSGTDPDFMVQCRREGTPGEIPRIPSLVELLAAV